MPSNRNQEAELYRAECWVAGTWVLVQALGLWKGKTALTARNMDLCLQSVNFADYVVCLTLPCFVRFSPIPPSHPALLQVIVNDFFLVACLEDFIENARLFIFETFCRIHQCISIK